LKLNGILSDRYLAFINEKLQENPREARVGGVPDLRLRIGAFVRLIFKKGDSWIDQNLEIVNDTPIWLLVYLYLRCGKPELVSGLIDTQALFTSAPDFPSYFRDYIGSENGL
jgi:nuclear pore complex protein Nup93